jgi:lysophospholipase L1-like esterase
MIKYSKIFFINIIILIIIFFITEIAISIFKPNHLIRDNELGWKLRPNYKKDKTEKDFYDQTYNVRFEVNSSGIVEVGDKKDKSISILVLGDSFSLDPYVSNEKMWYGILKSELKKKLNKNITINVIGAGGYGSLQEYLLMKKLNLNNDLIILQFCSNDFDNNILEIEKINGSINQYSRRPYLDSKNEIYYDQSFFSKLLRTEFLGESRILNKILFWYGNNKNHNEINNELKDRSYYITKIILKKIRSLHPDKKYFIFNCEYSDNRWEKLAKETNFIPIIENSKNLQKAKNNNLKIYYSDGGHYNELGHEIMGLAISKNKQLLDAIRLITNKQ